MKTVILLASDDLRELHEAHNRWQSYEVTAQDGTTVEIRPWMPEEGESEGNGE